MKKINSAKDPMPFTLPESALRYSVGKDNPDQYVFLPRETFLDGFKTPVPLHIKKAILKRILDMRVDECTN